MIYAPASCTPPAELAAGMLSAALGDDGEADVLVAGAGGGAQAIVATRRLAPAWRFTAVSHRVQACVRLPPCH